MCVCVGGLRDHGSPKQNNRAGEEMRPSSRRLGGSWRHERHNNWTHTWLQLVKIVQLQTNGDRKEPCCCPESNARAVCLWRHCVEVLHADREPAFLSHRMESVGARSFLHAGTCVLCSEPSLADGWCRRSTWDEGQPHKVEFRETPSSSPQGHGVAASMWCRWRATAGHHRWSRLTWRVPACDK